MKDISRFRFFLWYFGRFKVPLIGHLKPKLIQIDDESIIIHLRLNHRSKNHLHSMYFGALAVGADLAGGLHAFYLADKKKLKIALAFKSFQARFLKRPESDVFFICTAGNTVAAMLDETQKSNTRVNQSISVQGYTHYPTQPELVAEFSLELSLKII